MLVVTAHHLKKARRSLYIDEVPFRSPRSPVALTRPLAGIPKKREGLVVTLPDIAAASGLGRYLPLSGVVSVGPFTVEPVWVGDRRLNLLIDEAWYYLSAVPDTFFAPRCPTTLLFPADTAPDRPSLEAFTRFVRGSGFAAVIASGPYAAAWRERCAASFPIEVRERPAQLPLDWRPSPET